MSPQLIGNNLLAYSLQIGLVVLAAAPVPILLAMRAPRARLWFWHVVLVACLLLPLAQPWTRSMVEVTTTVEEMAATAGPIPPVAPRFPVERVALWLIGAGAAVRGLWLLIGLFRLRRYRRAADFLDELGPGLDDLRRALAPRARLLISPEIGSPVTFGALRPVVLLPETFLELEPQVQRAILCHELLHVWRHDWVLTVLEEAVRALLWFHPAVWWLLGRIHLCREQTVDREVIAMTEAPHEYVDALLAIAGARPRLDLAPAPLFLRRRHLKQRVFSILKEGKMSKVRWFSALAAGLGILTVACWMAAAAFPLRAASQSPADAAGVTVDLGNAGIMHRDAVGYPESARTAGIQGTVLIEVQIASDGTVNDARVIAGPDELRRPALQSVLKWHFDKAAAGSMKQVSISFALPAGRAAKPAATEPKIGLAGNLAQKEWPGAVFKGIKFENLSPAAESELLALLPLKPGDEFSPAKLIELLRVLRTFDPHVVSQITVQKGESTRTLRLPAAAPKEDGETATPPQGTPLRVGGNAQQMKLVTQTRPVYPPEAKQAGIQGKVQLEAIIDKQGKVSNLRVLSGEPVLAQSALEAVRNWTYEPTLLNGAPVEVKTQIDVNYTLSN